VILSSIDEEHPGRLIEPPPGRAMPGLYGIEADHPDDGKRLYAYDPFSIDTIVATRMRPDGRYEHAVLDEYGMPIEWRTVGRPEFN
jgi:hypothetical protein